MALMELEVITAIFNFGRSTSGKSVNEITAMQITAVYACVRILSEAVASLPIHVYRYKDGGKEMVGVTFGTVGGLVSGMKQT